MEPGYMNATLLCNPTIDTFETVFIIKDYNYKLEKLTYSHYANVRATVEENESAKGLIYMTKFEGMKNKIYSNWFDKTLQEKELLQLITQEKLKYYLVDEKNKPVDILVIPNEIRDIAIEYYLECVGLNWSVEEFDQLVHETMRKYKSTDRIWDYVTREMN